MRDLYAIAMHAGSTSTGMDVPDGVPAHLAALLVADVTHGSGIRLQTVGDHLLGWAVAFERLLDELQSSHLVPGFRDVTLEDLALVVNRSPEVMGLAVDLHVDLVEVPAPVPEALHGVAPLPADVGGEQWPESVPPEAHRLVADGVKPPERAGEQGSGFAGQARPLAVLGCGCHVALTLPRGDSVVGARAGKVLRGE